jgi:hypothetical protein
MIVAPGTQTLPGGSAAAPASGHTNQQNSSLPVATPMFPTPLLGNWCDLTPTVVGNATTFARLVTGEEAGEPDRRPPNARSAVEDPKKDPTLSSADAAAHDAANWASMQHQQQLQQQLQQQQLSMMMGMAPQPSFFPGAGVAYGHPSFALGGGFLLHPPGIGQGLPFIAASLAPAWGMAPPLSAAAAAAISSGYYHNHFQQGYLPPPPPHHGHGLYGGAAGAPQPPPHSGVPSAPSASGSAALLTSKYPPPPPPPLELRASFVRQNTLAEKYTSLLNRWYAKVSQSVPSSLYPQVPPCPAREEFLYDVDEWVGQLSLWWMLNFGGENCKGRVRPARGAAYGPGPEWAKPARRDGKDELAGMPPPPPYGASVGQR